MTRLKYLDPADGQYKLLPVGGGGGGAEEVVISAGVLPTKSEELWVDTSVAAPVSDWSYADNRYLGSGFRNVIRNGDFSIAQRGNGPFTNNTYSIDGWLIGSSGGTISLNRIVAASGDASPRASFAVSGQSAAGDYTQFCAIIEDVNTLNGKTVTLSFDAWSTSGTPKIGIELEQLFGTGGTPSATQRFSPGAVTISTIRNRYSLTFTVPSVAGASLGTNGNHALRVNLWLSAGSSFAVRSSSIGIQSGTFNLTDVQLEEGSAATKFERLPVQQQLAWCQRYYQRVGEPIVGAPIANAALYSNVDHFAIIRIPLMRTNPSVSISGATHFKAWFSNTSSTTSSTYLSTSTSTAVEMVFSTGSSTPGIASFIRSAVANAYIDFSAEL